MIVPKNPIVLVLLLVILSITSGKRWIDYFIMSKEGDAGAMIGAAIMPVILLPSTIVLSCIALSKLPKIGSDRIPLFYWGSTNMLRQIPWSLLYGLIIIISLTWTISWFILCMNFIINGDITLAMKSGMYLVGSLGANYAWFCLRSLTCYPINADSPPDS